MVDNMTSEVAQKLIVRITEVLKKVRDCVYIYFVHVHVHPKTASILLANFS